jgi:hypothetical protein
MARSIRIPSDRRQVDAAGLRALAPRHPRHPAIGMEQRAIRAGGKTGVILLLDLDLAQKHPSGPNAQMLPHVHRRDLRHFGDSGIGTDRCAADRAAEPNGSARLPFRNTALPLNAAQEIEQWAFWIFWRSNSST